MLREISEWEAAAGRTWPVPAHVTEQAMAATGSTTMRELAARFIGYAESPARFAHLLAQTTGEAALDEWPYAYIDWARAAEALLDRDAPEVFEAECWWFDTGASGVYAGLRAQ